MRRLVGFWKRTEGEWGVGTVVKVLLAVVAVYSGHHYLVTADHKAGDALMESVLGPDPRGSRAPTRPATRGADESWESWADRIHREMTHDRGGH